MDSLSWLETLCYKYTDPTHIENQYGHSYQSARYNQHLQTTSFIIIAGIQSLQVNMGHSPRETTF